jgi:hypothetical protein
VPHAVRHIASGSSGSWEVVDQLTNLTSSHKSACGRIEVEKRFANAALLASQQVTPERGAGEIQIS